MAGRLSMIVFKIVVVAAMQLQSSEATTHVVGGGISWLVPPGGSAVYSTWDASQTFIVGDVLMFSFTTGRHDVAEVSKAAFDSCNTDSPISIANDGPTNITLTTAGKNHFISLWPWTEVGYQCLCFCTTALNHTHQPRSWCRPGLARPSRWLHHLRNPGFHPNLHLFNFTTRQHDVAEVTKAAFDSCNTTSPISIAIDGPANITLTIADEHHFICTFSRHCGLGQKLAINVSSPSSTSPSPSPQPSTLPPSSPSPPTPSSVHSPMATPPQANNMLLSIPFPTPSSVAMPPSSSATPPPSPSGPIPVSPTTPSETVVGKNSFVYLCRKIITNKYSHANIIVPRIAVTKPNRNRTMSKTHNRKCRTANGKTEA
ncbi:hypothetical protein RJ639_042304 [Escallonia herrerae]|uniref:Phytocyanin domain-containing protein n=1 Tax=Escallonia herrerae TaxID=1293975 RepID=A0AA89B315_9ASTE|nr:hypothetical protein RJ639_042304 [Escallonia herrerae]